MCSLISLVTISAFKCERALALTIPKTVIRLSGSNFQCVFFSISFKSWQKMNQSLWISHSQAIAFAQRCFYGHPLENLPLSTYPSSSSFQNPSLTINTSDVMFLNEIKMGQITSLRQDPGCSFPVLLKPSTLVRVCFLCLLNCYPYGKSNI